DVLFTDQDTRDSRGNYVPAYGYAHRPNYVPKNIKRLIDRKNISNNLRIVGARFGAYSMIIRRCGMKKILDFYRAYQIFLPFDMDFHTAPDIKLFTVLDDVVGHKLDAVSDNGSPSY
ncbi:MAG: hypothetical protein H7A38_00005, partial [Chlamydiales bacterium]|nr:hypothetical protein [Chlamydiales bacterium]